MLNAVLLVFLMVSPARAAEPSFIAGYAAAVLDQYGAGGSTVAVEGATVAISARGLSVPDKESLSRTLLRVKGVEVVRFPPDQRSYPLNDYGRNRWPKTETRAGAAVAVVPCSSRTAFPRRTLFEPLLADPREARFSVSSLRYRSGADLKRVAAGNFGGPLPMAGGDLDGGGQWQVAVQGAVFTLWDLETFSNDQISDDFLVGLPFTWRWDRLSVMARLYHISTHLGDEFLLTHPGLSRVNLAYEAVDVKVSYAATDALRLYGGVGRMIRRDPVDTPPGALQAGIEYTHPKSYVKGLLRPVASLDLQKHQKSGWSATDVSLRVGAQIENRTLATRRALLLWEYFKGKDPTGQFFRRYIEYTGLGLHVYF